MARSHGNNTVNNLSHPASFNSNNDPRPISVSIRILNGSGYATRQSLFSNNNHNDPKLYFDLSKNGANDALRLYSEGSYSSYGSNLTLTADDIFGVSWDTDDSVAFYHNGAAAGTTSFACGASARTTGAVIGSLRAIGETGFDIDGETCEFGCWDVILSGNDFAALGDQVSPRMVRPDALVGYLPIYGRSSPEVDEISGNTWTINGTLTRANHPRTIFPGHSFAIGGAAGGGSPQTVTPDAVALPLVAPSPTVLTPLTVTPDAATLPLVAPSVTTATPLTVTPDAATLPLAAPNPTIALALTITPDAVTLPLVAPAPTVLTPLTVTPDAATLPLVVPNPTVSADLTVTPDAAVLTLVVPTPTSVSAGAPDMPGLEYQVAPDRLHFRVPGEKLHFRLEPDKLHFRVDEEP